MTIVAVARRWNTPAADQRFIMKWTSSVGWYLTAFSAGTTGLTVQSTGSGTGQATVFGLGVPVVVAGVRNVTADTVTAYSNGTAGTPVTDGTTASLANADSLSIGRQNSGASSYIDMELLAVAVFRRALTASELAAIAAYYGA
jgi:hypothetical protein